MMASESLGDAPPPRLCHLFKWDDFDGYGFNLHGEKSKPGQYIGKVDPGSPAEAAGLKSQDRIMEVNGTNIANENHKQVVQRIKAIPNETKLLVLDDVADDYYKSKSIVVTGAMPNVLYLKTPVPRPAETTNLNASHIEKEMNGNGHIDDDRTSHASDSGSGSLPSKTNSLKKGMMKNGNMHDEEMSSTGASPTPPESISASPSPTPYSSSSSDKSLNLNMTAQEMRAKLAAKKKDKLDPKTQKMDFRKKYEIIQTL